MKNKDQGTIIIPKHYFFITKDDKGKVCGKIRMFKKDSPPLYSKIAATLMLMSIMITTELPEEERISIEDAISNSDLPVEFTQADFAQFIADVAKDGKNAHKDDGSILTAKGWPERPNA